MPELKTSVRWERFEPDLPGNRASKSPFYFEVAADLSKEQFRALQRQLDRVDDYPAPPANETEDEAEARRKEQLAESLRRTAVALDPYVKFGVEPLTINGEAITSLQQYLVAVSSYQTMYYVTETTMALTRANTVGGPQRFFSERLSGGFGSTR